MIINRHLFIVNPIAGRGEGANIEKDIEEIFSEIKKYNKNVDYTIEFTKYVGHATEIAREYSKKDSYIMYAVGGDGTLNEVLNGMAFSSTVLAFIPYGTGNDFMNSIAYKYNKETILQDTIAGKIEEADLGEVNGRYFVNVASVGIDSLVNHYANEYKTSGKYIGKKAYIMGILKALTSKKRFNLKISIGENTMEDEYFLVAAGNGKSYGGGFNIAPLASINDGLLDIVVVKNYHLFRILGLIVKLVRKKHLDSEHVQFYRSGKMSVESSEDLIINLDGDEMVSKNFNVLIHKNSLKVLVPLININKNS